MLPTRKFHEERNCLKRKLIHISFSVRFFQTLCLSRIPQFNSKIKFSLIKSIFGVYCTVGNIHPYILYFLLLLKFENLICKCLSNRASLVYFLYTLFLHEFVLFIRYIFLIDRCVPYMSDVP